MYEPDLPDTLEFQFVRRWYCGVCGDRRAECPGGVCSCESDGWTGSRHIQFLIRK